MKIVTRFAPSPTGFLHIGGARTALFNWLLARHYSGEFLLRIEDTDRERSTQGAVDAIFRSLEWLGIKWDGDPVFQSSKASRHAEIAAELIKEKKAYLCYCSPEELDKMREDAKKQGLSLKYNGFWRDRDSEAAPKGVSPVVRLKVPLEGKTVVNDIVQGAVTVANNQLDDMVLLRSDGSPTFMLSVVVDDHDMGVTHVIRGDDHLTNTFRQIQIYEALGWEPPKFGHIPLIHGPDGAKLSKRHGALGVENYKEMGLLPEAVCNCLLRLGWSHGNDEIISMKQAIEWFTTDNLGKSASRLDFLKLENLNSHYMKEADNDKLLGLLLEILGDLPEQKREWLRTGMDGLKQRSKTLLELRDISAVYTNDHAPAMVDEVSSVILRQAADTMQNVNDWTDAVLEKDLRALSLEIGIPFGKVAQPLRSVLTGKKITPNIFEMLVVFGKDESLRRVRNSLLFCV